MKKTLLQLLWMSLAVCLSVNLCFAQSNGLGLQPYQIYDGARENINVGNGNLYLTLPLASLLGRDGHDLNVSMNYNSKAWVLKSYTPPQNGALPIYYWAVDPDAFWRLPLATTLHREPVTTGSVNPGRFELTCWKHYAVTLPDGSTHAFPNVQTNCWKRWCEGGNTVCGVGTGPAPEYDVHTGSTMDAPMLLHVDNNTVGANPPTISFPDGHKVTGCNGSGWNVEDANGNCIAISGVNIATGGFTNTTITDTVGRNLTVTSSEQPPYNETIQYTDSNGTLQTIYLNNAQVTLAPHFSGVPDPEPRTGPVLSSIVLPSGLSYTFQYNEFGELTKITYPAGGYTRYDYATFQSGAPSSSRPSTDGRWVVARHVCRRSDGACTPGVDEDDTTYSPVYNPDLVTFINTVIESPGTSTQRKTVYQGGGGSKTVYNADGSVAETITIDYSDSGPAAHTLIGRPIRKTSTLPNGLVKKTEWDYDSANDPYSLLGNPVPNDNILNEHEYDWGNGAPGPLLRTTHNDWLHVNSVNGVDYTAPSVYMLNRKADTIVYDGAGNLVSETLYEYDNYNTFGLRATGAVQHDSAYAGANTVARGNLTAVRRWRNTDGAWLLSSNGYDDAGNVVVTTDPMGNPTYFDYTDAWGDAACVPTQGPANAYLTTATNALGHVIHKAYNSCTGAVASATDANNQTTTYAYNDSMGRLTSVTGPPDPSNGNQQAQTTYGYVDTPNYNAPYIYQQDKIDATHQTTSWTQFDGLGRVIRTAKLNGEAGPNIVDDVDTCYDTLGQKQYQTYPYQGPGWLPGTYHCPPDSATPAGDSFTYDALGRLTQVTHADNSAVSTDYSQFPAVTVSDEAGRQRRNQTDALGRLLTVWEPDGNGNLSYETDYYYNALDNLEHVVQKGNDPNSARQRDFQYDSLSRLLTASNPESGTIQYGYDANGNLINKTSPAPNQTDPSQTITYYFGYDALNRLIWKWHPNSSDPVERYWYDLSSVWGTTAHNSIGRLVLGQSDGGSNGSTGTIHSYDLMGREEFDLQYNKRGDPSVHKQFNYAYNLDGSLKSITYPSARVVNYGYNVAQRPISAVDSNNISFATAAHYTGSGALGYVVNGATSSFGGIVATENYNLRMQPNEIHVAVGAQPPLLDLVYDFYSCGGNNGNVCAVTNTKDSARSQAFAYDYMNRLVWAWTPNLNSSGVHNWGEGFTYDPWGNLLQKSTMGSDNPPDTSLNVTVNTRNQATNWCYDAAGNVIDPTQPCPNPPPSSYPNTYDGQNRLTVSTVGASTISYDYDADGQRVKKTGSTNTLYWYGPGSEVLEETDLNGNLQNEYIFFGGKRVTRYNPANGYSYYFSDQLGSADVVTDALGNIKEESDFYPFGGERVVTDLGLDNRYKFTGKERDPETGCDYFGARYYCNPIGRFITPDWAAAPTEVPYANFGNPQSLNLYSYVKNNPTTFGDPDGHCDRSDWCGFIAGAVNAYASDNMFGAGRADSFMKYTNSEQNGATLGDAVATIQGAGETLIGVGGEVGGVILDATGVGAIIGVPTGIASTAAIIHGGGTAIVGGAHLLKDASESGGTKQDNAGPKAKDGTGVSSSGQATDEHGNKLGGSGKPQQHSTESNTRERATNKALSEGSTAVNHPNPKQGKPHVHSGDAEGNKKPNSTHHNYPE